MSGAITPLAQAAWLAVHIAAWWFAVWLSIGRREQLVVPLLGVLFLGLGPPIVVADLLVTSGHSRWQGLVLACWTAVPLVTIACNLAVAWRRLRGRRQQRGADS
jgi:hypothetical protein